MGRMISYSTSKDVNDINDELFAMVGWLKEEFDHPELIQYSNQDCVYTAPFDPMIIAFLETWLLPVEHQELEAKLGYVTIWQCSQFTVCHLAYEADRWHDFVIVDVDDMTAVKYKLSL